MQPANPVSPRFARCPTIELPSWAFRRAGRPRNPYEVVAEAAVVQQFTGGAAQLALYLPSDHVDDYADLARHAHSYELAITSLHPAVDFAALVDTDAPRGERIARDLGAVAHIAGKLGVRQCVLRVPEETRYPGHAQAQARRERLLETLQDVLDRLHPETQLVIELDDWRKAQQLCTSLGSQTKVQLRTDNTGHGVATLQATGQLGRVVLDQLGHDEFSTFCTVVELAESGLLTDTVGPVICVDPTRWPLTDSGSLIQLVLAAHAHLTRASYIDFLAHTGAVAIAQAVASAYHTPVSDADLCRQLGVSVDPVGSYHAACREQFHAVARQSALRRSFQRRRNAVVGPEENPLRLG